jgi:hypothetical protein
VQDEPFERLATLWNDEEPPGLAPGGERLLDGSPAGDDFVVGADEIRGRLVNGGWPRNTILVVGGTRRPGSKLVPVPERRAPAGVAALIGEGPRARRTPRRPLAAWAGIGEPSRPRTAGRAAIRGTAPAAIARSARGRGRIAIEAATERSGPVATTTATTPERPPRPVAALVAGRRAIGAPFAAFWPSIAPLAVAAAASLGRAEGAAAADGWPAAGRPRSVVAEAEPAAALRRPLAPGSVGVVARSRAIVIAGSRAIISPRSRPIVAPRLPSAAGSRPAGSRSARACVAIAAIARTATIAFPARARTRPPPASSISHR